MAKARKAITRTGEYGATSRGQMFQFDPEDLDLVTDPADPLYQPDVTDPLPDNFVKGIMKHGLKKPVTLRRNGTQKDGKAILQVVDGRTGVRGARAANKLLRAAGKPIVLVRGIVEKGLRAAEAEDLMILLNTHRKVLDRVSLARQLKRYFDHGHTEQEAKITFGYKPHEFKVLMQVMEMSDCLQEALRDKRITLEVARTLAALPEEKQAAALADTLKEAGGRGDKAKAVAVEKTRAAGGLTPNAKPRPKTNKVLLSTLDQVACMPKTDYRSGVLDTIEWMLGKRHPAWAAEGKAAGT